MIFLLIYLVFFSVVLLALDLLFSGAMLVKFIGAAILSLIGFFAFVPYLMNKIYPKLGLTLDFRLSNEAGYVSTGPAHNELLGKTGWAVTQLHPCGTVCISDRYIDVVAEDFHIQKGTAVQVIAVDFGKVVVRSIPPANQKPS